MSAEQQQEPTEPSSQPDTVAEAQQDVQDVLDLTNSHLQSLDGVSLPPSLQVCAALGCDGSKWATYPLLHLLPTHCCLTFHFTPPGGGPHGKPTDRCRPPDSAASRCNSCIAK